MTGTQRAIMTGIHTLDHIQCLLTADLTNDNSVRPQYKKVNVK